MWKYKVKINSTDLLVHDIIEKRLTDSNWWRNMTSLAKVHLTWHLVPSILSLLLLVSTRRLTAGLSFVLTVNIFHCIWFFLPVQVRTSKIASIWNLLGHKAKESSQDGLQSYVKRQWMCSLSRDVSKLLAPQYQERGQILCFGIFTCSIRYYYCCNNIKILRRW